MGKRKEPAVKKIIDLQDKIEAYRASALAARKGPAWPGNLALASAAAGGAALAVTPAAEAAIQYSGLQNISVTDRSVSIDVDGNKVNDFRISHDFSTYMYTYTYTYTYTINGTTTITTSSTTNTTYNYNSARLVPRNNASL